MGIVAVLICAVLYAATSIDAGRKRDWPMCITFAGYAFANIGLIWALKRGGSE